MPASSHVYGLALQSLAEGLIAFPTASVKALLATSTYVPNQDTHRWLTSVVRTVADGVTNSTTTVTSATAAFTSADVGSRISGGSIPGGATISSVTNATTVIISAAATASASGVSITVTDEANGTGYTAGGLVLTSKTLTYNSGTNTLVWDCADPAWATATVTARYVIFYVDTGTGSTSPLISYVDFGSDQASSGGTFTYPVPTTGIAQFVAA